MLKKIICLFLFVLLPVCSIGQTPTPSKPLDLLKHSLERISQSVSADWGIYVKSLDTGEEIAINADKVMDTMSVIKVPLLVDAYRQVDSGRLNPAERIILEGHEAGFDASRAGTQFGRINAGIHLADALHDR